MPFAAYEGLQKMLTKGWRQAGNGTKQTPQHHLSRMAMMRTGSMRHGGLQGEAWQWQPNSTLSRLNAFSTVSGLLRFGWLYQGLDAHQAGGGQWVQAAKGYYSMIVGRQMKYESIGSLSAARKGE